MSHFEKLLRIQSALEFQLRSNHSSIVHFVGHSSYVHFSSLVDANNTLETDFKGLISTYSLSVEHPNAGHKPTSEQLNCLSYAYHVVKDNLLRDKEHLRRLNAPQYALDKVDTELEEWKDWLWSFQQLWH